MSHTPGPWRVVTDPEDKDILLFAVENAHGIILCDCYPCDAKHNPVNFMPSEMEANTNLIAAAPELLEVLESILSDVYFEDDKGCYAVDSDKLIKAQAVIAKAKGDSQ